MHQAAVQRCTCMHRPGTLGGMARGQCVCVCVVCVCDCLHCSKHGWVSAVLEMLVCESMLVCISAGAWGKLECVRAATLSSSYSSPQSRRGSSCRGFKTSKRVRLCGGVPPHPRHVMLKACQLSACVPHKACELQRHAEPPGSSHVCQARVPLRRARRVLLEYIPPIACPSCVCRPGRTPPDASFQPNPTHPGLGGE